MGNRDFIRLMIKAAMAWGGRLGLAVTLTLALALVIGCGDSEEPESQKTTVKKEVKAPTPTDPASKAKKLAGDVKKAKDTLAKVTERGGTEQVEAEEGPVVEDVSTLLKIWEEEGKKFVFDATDRQDPFMPIVHEEKEVKVAPKTTIPLTPLMRVDLSSISLVAVITYGDEARALVEDATGTGYIIKKGTFIGRNNGQVVGIHPALVRSKDGLKEVVKPARVQVAEQYRTYFDPTLKTRIIEILLKGEEQ